MQSDYSDNVAALLDRSLEPATLALVRYIASAAEQRGATLFIVGGTVRDLLLRRAPADLDLLVEGDAIGLAAVLAQSLGGTSLAHEPFRTAVLELPTHWPQTLGLAEPAAAPLVLDLISTRSETYTQPAALPTVQHGSLRDDLFRRDFSINTLAVCVSAGCYGQLYDVYGGRADLAAGVLRVLHDQSFADDPTRMLRAARFAGRLGYHLEPHTAALFRAALAQQLIERTSPQRIANELRLVLHEPQPERAIDVLNTMGALPHLLPALRWSDTLANRFRAARAALAEPTLPRVYFALLSYPLASADRETLIERYRPPASLVRLLRDVSLLRDRMPQLAAPDLLNSQLDVLLAPFSETALQAARLSEPAPFAAQIDHYLTDLRLVAIELSGKDLQQLGLQPGPRFGALLAELRAARLDGLLHTRADEQAWVLQKG